MRELWRLVETCAAPRPSHKAHLMHDQLAGGLPFFGVGAGVGVGVRLAASASMDSCMSSIDAASFAFEWPGR
jgi:hypothetical protein